MNANELYEKLQQIGKPLVHVESLVSTMQLEIPVEEIEKHIELFGVNFLLVEVVRYTFDGFLSPEYQPYIDKFIAENELDEDVILNIRNKTSSDIGLVNVGFNLNGCILGLTHTDEWMEHLFHLVKFITDSEKREKSRNFWTEQDKIKEQKVLEKQAKEKEREVMIQQVEDLTNTDDFKLCKTKGEILLFWEKNIPDLYKTLSRTFMETMSKKYISILRGS
ncbi:hypothetical protein PYR74_00565 (plasmid) [Acinetobacter bereziniae]|uniref:hypothetical protein n=1 Tax=Acinetobacter TaxID=469 RepID=UPI0003B8BF67|nr:MULTISPECIES: hypothetical protein [Acinetobacter]MCF1283038.1 hypothetical protein [Acinetobacter pittii]WEI20959.1 hypothetical protein PYR74_00565 [Acinetobacter bereziniae]CDI28186.1 hypothetical protein APICBIBUN_P2_15652 [Acinetobacter pittii 42F]